MEKDDKNLELFPLDGTDYQTLLTEKYRQRKSYEPEDPNRITAMIPGTILKIMVREGQSVNPSKCLFILEAMKMKNKVYPQVAGIVKKIHIEEGAIVTKKQILLELGEPDSIFRKLREKAAKAELEKDARREERRARKLEKSKKAKRKKD